MTLRKSVDILSKLKPLVLIPLLVLLVVFTVRACLEMVLVLRMTSDGYIIFNEADYEDGERELAESTLPSSSSSTCPTQKSQSSSPPSPISRERSQFGWNSGRSSSNQYSTLSIKHNYQHFHKNEEASAFSQSDVASSSRPTESVGSVEHNFLTNIMVVSLL